VRRRKRWENWQPESKDTAGDMPDPTSRAWKAASPLIRASHGDPSKMPAAWRISTSPMPSESWQRSVRGNVSARS
jgi:hypothetical protein